MTTHLECVSVDAADPAALARWWAAALGWRITVEEADEVAVEPAEGEPGIPLTMVRVGDPKQVKNRLHPDLASASLDDQARIVERLEGLGARRVDIGQRDVPWVVLADPEGNEFCVLDPRQEYDDSGALAAVVVDARDPYALAEFWSAATGWPVARTGDHYATLRPPEGRSPALEFIADETPKTVKNRLHLEVAPWPDGDQRVEVERLIGLGASRIDIGQGDVRWVVLADPEGNEFCVLSPR
jgi:predicted enzyme related to lactoylglutathione lyase